MKYILAVIILLVQTGIGPGLITAQVPVVRSANKVVIEGRVYYVHLVTPGQTLYSISKAYEISEMEIARENPGADKLLSAGQVLKIPVVPSGSEEQVSNLAPAAEGNYLRHIIRQGETVYSLSKLYHVTPEEIERANPGLIITDIPTGMQINIPQVGQPEEKINFTYHRVRRRDTIYGICRKYGITEEQLKRYNPDLNESLPRTGQKLRIPVMPESPDKQVQEEVIAVTSDTTKAYTLYSDSLDYLSGYQYYLDSLPPISGRALNVAYLIPFNYADTGQAVPESNESQSTNKVQQKIPDKGNIILSETRNFQEFMEGTLLAVDKIRDEGVSVNAYIFDTKRSPERVREIIYSPGFETMDLLVGPFFSFNLEIVAPFAQMHHIPVVSPFYDEPELASSNPFVFQVSPSYYTEYNFIADYVVRNRKADNIVAVFTPDSLQAMKREYLCFKIEENIFESENRDSIMFNEITYDNANRAEFQNNLTNALSRTKLNYIIITEEDEAFVKPVISMLYFLPKVYRVKVIGMPHWMTFQSIDYSYFHQLELSFFTPHYFSYDSTGVKNFLKTFTNQFYSEPRTFTRKGCSYAFIGYDITNYFLSLMGRYGRQFITRLDEDPAGNILGGFKFDRISKYGGFENRSLNLVTFRPDFGYSVENYQNIQPERAIRTDAHFLQLEQP